LNFLALIFDIIHSLWKTPKREINLLILLFLQSFPFSQDRLAYLSFSPPFQPFISIFPLFIMTKKSNNYRIKM